jgi:hypothetical protein
LRFSENLSRNRRLVRPWTVGDRLRHSKFVGLRGDKDADLWSRPTFVLDDTRYGVKCGIYT